VALRAQERILPAWSLLDEASLEGLLGPGPAISIVDHAAPHRTEAPLVALIRLLIVRAIAEKGLALTGKGNLSRADVAALFAELDWPGFDKETTLALNKVLNEQDAFPIRIARIVAQESAPAPAQGPVSRDERRKSPDRAGPADSPVSRGFRNELWPNLRDGV